jgi:hypothetical protein
LSALRNAPASTSSTSAGKEDPEKVALRAELEALRKTAGQATVSSDPFTVARQILADADARADKQLERLTRMFEQQLERVTRVTPAAGGDSSLGRELFTELGELRARVTAPRGPDIAGIITAAMPAVERVATIAEKIAEAKVEESRTRVAVMTATNRDKLLAAGYQLADDGKPAAAPATKTSESPAGDENAGERAA